MQSLHLVILFLAFGCKAEVNLLSFTTDKPVVTENTTDASEDNWFFFKDDFTNLSYKTVTEPKGEDVTTSNSSSTVLYNITQQTTTKQTKRIKNYTVKSQPPNTMANITCTGEEKFKTGIIICVIIIAILVFIIAMLIVCIVALANKVSSLKARLTQSKRQARSNGDFLSASSILWPSGMETWQKKGNLSMDEISLGDANTIEYEKHKLMASPALDKTKDATDENTNSPSTAMIISTVEV